MTLELNETRKRKACQWSLDQFGRACDGELTGAELERFAFHAAQCPHCRAEYGALQAQIATLRGLRHKELSESFVFETIHRIGALNRPSPWMVPAVWRMATLAVVFAVGVSTVADHTDMAASPDLAQRQYGLRLPTVQVDYVDAASLQPVELDMVLHRAHELNQNVRLSPVVPALDRHRRVVVEEAAYQTVAADLGRYGDIASTVQIGEPVEVQRMSSAPFVVMVETGN